MIKRVCDITGKIPAFEVHIYADTNIVLNIDLCQEQLDILVNGLKSKIAVSDVQAVIVKAQV